MMQQQLGGSTIKNNGSLDCMTMIDQTIGSLGIVEFKTYALDEVTVSNYEYIDE